MALSYNWWTYRRAASLAASRTSGFSALFFWITSKEAPTIDLEYGFLVVRRLFLTASAWMSYREKWQIHASYRLLASSARSAGQVVACFSLFSLTEYYSIIQNHPKITVQGTSRTQPNEHGRNNRFCKHLVRCHASNRSMQKIMMKCRLQKMQQSHDSEDS